MTLENIKKIYHKFFKSSFAKSIALITGGTVFAQAMGILFSPIITRIYPPEQYGVLTTYTAVLGLIVIIASLSYQQAIPIAEDDEKAINVMALSVIILVIIVFAITLLIYIAEDFVLKILNSEDIKTYIYLIPVGVFFEGLYNIVIEWNFRKRSYKTIAKNKVVQSLTSNFTKIALGILNFGPIGLIIGLILGQSAGITALSRPVFNQKGLLSRISFSEIKKVAKRYMKFPVFSAPSNYVYTAGNNLPVVFLASLFGNAVTGLFGLARGITELPMNLIGNSVAQVFYSEAANIGKSNPREIKRLSIKLIRKLALIALLPLVTLLLFGPWLFSFVFGNQWYEAGVYARILSVMVYFHFIILPIGRILEIFERQREGLILNIIRLAMILTVFYISRAINLTSYQTVALYSLSNSITYIALLIIVIKIMNSEIKTKEKKMA